MEQIDVKINEQVQNNIFFVQHLQIEAVYGLDFLWSTEKKCLPYILQYQKNRYPKKDKSKLFCSFLGNDYLVLKTKVRSTTVPGNKYQAILY